ncbi:MAG: thiamine biosynthesis protein ThiP [Bdellovibrio sp. ArHS]|uniref:ABC transporter permease subunit n=1 Tax=Bdellovibrio sp. ArHS TaxID=1569284 RepID=UPI00058260E8|nr:ABC transporter permease subunit [Bdellovibrio sp. ArHS]KHD89730.1 MAG: thiamine biosynthesis protein ThiP [Bdellovibrio sp. ArHS]
MSLSRALRLGVVLFLLFPFLFLLTQFRITGIPDLGELLWAFKNSFVQAFFSAVFSLMLGFWVSLGLLSLSTGPYKKARFVFEILCLLPNFLPPIFILLATLNLVDPFPMGVAGIVLIHTLMNFGLVAVLLAGIIENKMGGMIELAYVEGAGRWQFLTRGLFPFLKKDLWLLGLFIFVVCFGSFAVPLVVGGGKGTTVEVLIYEKIRLSSNWGDAVLLAFLQSTFIFAFSFIASRGKGAVIAREANLDLIKTYSGVFVIAGLSFLYLFGYLQGFVEGLALITNFYELQSALFWNFLGSVILGLTVGILCYAGLMLIAYCWPKAWFEKFLNGYVAPSTSLACFSLLLLGPNEGLYPFIKIPVALTLLSLNSLFRMGWDGELHSLQSQITVAYAMGASRTQIFKEILFPQLSARAGLLAGIASVWACGDFAVSRILAHRDLSIAMMTETLMSGYRLNQAIVLSSLIVVAGFFCFLVCVGGSRVLRRKFAP